jgi:nucleotide-binding universal stress UspA family protein
MNTIVLATDGSPSAEKATRVAIELARDTGSRLCVCSVWEDALTIYPYAPMTAIPEVEKAEKGRAIDAARKAVQLAEEEGVETESFVREGDPVHVISETAASCGASFLVVGSHGWGPVRRLVFGSVSTGLLHHAPCPVLVARSDPEAAIPEPAAAEEAVV